MHLIPPDLLERSGAVYYSGLLAWDPTTAAPVYLLGLNPGGDPETSPTIAEHTAVPRPDNWSAYRDEGLLCV